MKRLYNPIFLLFGISIFLFLGVLACKKDSQSEQIQVTTTEPPFKKEGELSILSADGKDTIKHLNIELADDFQQQAQGLMYRTSMKENQGMLFVNDKEEVRNFWMKNTKIPLDLMFVDKNKAIISIQKNAIPLSEEGISSVKPAMYVLEVNGGMCDLWGVEIGDKIEYQTSN